MKMDAPAKLGVVDPSEVDAAWLSAALRQAGYAVNVDGFEVSPVGTGQVGETYRYVLRYTSGADERAPATIIGKFHSSDAGSRAIAKQLGLYRREYNFYRELVGSTNVSAPHPYLVLNDEDDRFVMLLEDAAPARPADHLTGVTIDHALLALLEAAKLHASHWGDDALENSAWLQSQPLAQGIISPAELAPFWPGFKERYADMVSPDLLAVGEQFIAHGETWNRPRPTPRSLTHNDFRPDNFLFATPEGGRPVTIVDWQTVTFCYGVLDVAYLIGGAFEGDARREAEAVLLPAYYDALTQAGVRDYSHEQFMADYRHFTFAGLSIAISAAMTVTRTERGDALFLNMFVHHASHVIDQNAIGYLTC
jgi:Ecdysteroid kinase-like family